MKSVSSFSSIDNITLMLTSIYYIILYHDLSMIQKDHKSIQHKRWGTCLRNRENYSLVLIQTLLKKIPVVDADKKGKTN